MVRNLHIFQYCWNYFNYPSFGGTGSNTRSRTIVVVSFCWCSIILRRWNATLNFFFLIVRTNSIPIIGRSSIWWKKYWFWNVVFPAPSPPTNKIWYTFRSMTSIEKSLLVFGYPTSFPFWFSLDFTRFTEFLFSTKMLSKIWKNITNSLPTFPTTFVPNTKIPATNIEENSLNWNSQQVLTFPI